MQIMPRQLREGGCGVIEPVNPIPPRIKGRSMADFLPPEAYAERAWQQETGMELCTSAVELKNIDTYVDPLWARLLFKGAARRYVPVRERWWVRALVFLRLAGYEVDR